MFNNYEMYYTNYTKYLLTREAQLNVSDMDSGFSNVDTFIMHIYGNCLSHKYYGKYSEVKNSLIFVDSTIAENERTTA